MRLKGFFILLVGIFSGYASVAQIKGELTQSRILILLDESSSMIQTWGSGKPKYKAADELILRLMDSIYAVNDQVEFSLRVFGHQHTVQENNCYDTKNEVAFSRNNRVQMGFRLEDIRPLGVTPIAYALQEAADHDLVDEAHNAYSIILITDGGESCGGDLCGVMKKLIANKIFFRPYIVSLEDVPGLKTSYACMGDYLQVTKDGDIPKAVTTIVEAFRPIIKITPAEYKQMQVVAAKTPSILKVNVPIIDLPTDTAKKVTPPPPPAITIPKTDKLSVAPVAKLHPLFVPTTVPAIAAARTVPVLPALVIDVPPPPPPPVVIPKTDKLTRATIARTNKITIERPVAIVPAEASVPALPPLVFEKPAPPPPPPPVVITIPKTDKMNRVSIARPKTYTVGKPAAGTTALVAIPALPALVINVPPPPAPPPPPPPAPVVVTIPKTTKLTQAIPAKRRTLTVEKPEIKTPKSAKVPPLPGLVIEIPAPPPVVPVTPPPPPPAPKPAAEKIARLTPAKPVRINKVFVVEERAYVQRAIPPLPPLKIDLPKLPPAKPGTTAANVPPTGKKLDYKIETEDAKTTSLEIYIVNSKGQPVTTSPQVVLLDQATKKEVKKFYRTVGPAGDPDPQENIPVGTYAVTFPAKKNLVIPNVHVEPNKRNKITVRVKDVSLYFYYIGATDRPVKEFGAQVIEREKVKGRVQDQLCSTTLQYEPGNYHIRINTFPEDKRNVDLDLDEETGIGILQPGFAKFTTDSKQKITLWKEDGNRYTPFFELNTTDPRAQHLQIQPGSYQVHFHKGPGGPSASEKSITFIIRSNGETEVNLQ